MKFARARPALSVFLILLALAWSRVAPAAYASSSAEKLQCALEEASQQCGIRKKVPTLDQIQSALNAEALAQTFSIPGALRPATVPAILETAQQDPLIPLPLEQEEEAFTEQELAGIYALARIIKDHYVGQVGPEEIKKMYYGALAGMVKGLGDPHSTFMDPEEHKRFNEQMTGSFSGIGAGMKKKEKGKYAGILYIIPGGGAEKAQLQANDEIAKIDGEDTRPLELEDVIGKIKGKEGTPVTLTLQRKDPKTGSLQTWTVTIVRQAFQMPNVLAKMVGPNAGYIYFNEFRGESQPGAKDDSAALLAKAVRELQAKGASSLVLDLRNNPGGRLDIAAKIVASFLNKGDVLFSVKDRRGRTQTAKAPADGEFKNIPLTVLVNGYSASASELFAGAMQDHQRAKVFGSTTYGKGSVQSIIPFTDGSGLRLTTQYYYTPSGRSVNKDPKTGKGGVTPDTAVALSEEEEAKVMAKILRELSKYPPENGDEAVQDPALEKALKP